jgi:hypothetical protein
LWKLHDPALAPPLRVSAGLIFAVLWFGSIEYRRLIDPDEGRYAEISREMVASGDWLTPRLNDLKYFEKPPLQYWATATAFTLFGEHQWTARLWSALTGFFGILFTVAATGRLFNPTTGWIAGAVLASSLLWNLIGHINTLDMGVSAFLAAAVFALCLAQRDDATPAESRRWQDGAWALLALATLSKGLIGIVLPAATVVLYTVWQRDWGFIARIRPWRGLTILLLITAPWFIAVSLANPEFAWFFFVHEHFQRFLTKVHHRYEPMWYFIPILMIGILPWLGSLLPGLKAAKASSAPGFSPPRFLLAWTVVVFGFFSVSSSKLASYILPIFPSIAVLLGVYLARMDGNPRLSLAGRADDPGRAGRPGCWQTAPPDSPASRSRSSVTLPTSPGCTPPPWPCCWAARWPSCTAARGRALAFALALGIGGHVFGQLFLLGHDEIGRVNSAHDAALAIRDKLPPGVPFFSADTYDQSLQFYLKRTTTMVAYRDEMSFGISQEPHKFIPTLGRIRKPLARITGLPGH